MIEGTKSYRRKDERKNSSTSAAPEVEPSGTQKVEPKYPVDDASINSETKAGLSDANDAPMAEAARRENGLDRRAWLSSLVPALGDGLVKILRASNNLKDDLGLRR